MLNIKIQLWIEGLYALDFFWEWINQVRRGAWIESQEKCQLALLLNPSVTSIINSLNKCGAKMSFEAHKSLRNLVKMQILIQ